MSDTCISTALKLTGKIQALVATSNSKLFKGGRIKITRDGLYRGREAVIIHTANGSYYVQPLAQDGVTPLPDQIWLVATDFALI